MTAEIPELSDEMKRIVHESWEQDTPGVIVDEDGPRFRMFMWSNVEGQYHEPIPDIHYRWMDEHTCRYCPDNDHQKS